MASSSSTYKWLVTISVMIPTLVEVLDSSVANVALRYIQGSLAASQSQSTWVLTSYLMANAIVIPMSAWLAGFMGRKRYLLISLTVFVAASMLCGMAQTLPQLILFRLIQGAGGGGLQSMSQAILLESFPAKQRGLAMSIFGMGVVLGPVIGPVLGGWITDQYSWRWIFYINLPLGILGLVMLSLFVKEDARQAVVDKFDALGLMFLVLGIGSLQIVLDKGQEAGWFNSWMIIILSTVAVVSLIALVIWELSTAYPLLKLSVFRDRNFGLGNIIIFLGYFSAFGAIVLLPMYVQTFLGYNAFLAGLVLGPGGLIMLVFLPMAGKLSARLDTRILLAFGLMVLAYASYRMRLFDLSIDFMTAVDSRIIQSIGMSFFFVPLATLTFLNIDTTNMNSATAFFNLIKNLGGSFGTSFVSTMLARREDFHQSRLSEHLTPYDMNCKEAMNSLQNYFATHTSVISPDSDAMSAMYRHLQEQASYMSYIDIFQCFTIFFLLLVPCVVVMRGKPNNP